MPVKCEKCGMTIHVKHATKCLVCGEPLPNDFIESRQSDRLSQGSQADNSSGIDTTSYSTGSWLASVIHRRAKGGVFLGVILTVLGIFGGSYTRRGATIGGGELIGIGLFVIVTSVILFLATPAGKQSS